MTTRTHTTVVCVCGHKGTVHTAENDAPFSKEWFQRSVDGFIDHDKGWGTKDLTCKACGRRGEVSEVAG